MVSLSSKNYVCYLPEKGYQKKKDKWFIDGKDAYFKLSAKGVQKSKNIETLTPEKFESVIEEGISIKATNRGFCIDKLTNGIVTYEQCKTGITHWYDKRIVLADGITTAPLTI